MTLPSEQELLAREDSMRTRPGDLALILRSRSGLCLRSWPNSGERLHDLGLGPRTSGAASLTCEGP